MAEKFICPVCGEGHTPEEWNEKTRDEYGRLIRFEEDISLSGFICPSCEMEVTRDEIFEKS